MNVFKYSRTVFFILNFECCHSSYISCHDIMANYNSQPGITVKHHVYHIFSMRSIRLNVEFVATFKVMK